MPDCVNMAGVRLSAGPGTGTPPRAMSSRAEALRAGRAPRLRHDLGGGACARSRFRFGSGGPHGSCRDFASASGSGNRLRRRRRLLPVWGAERGCARRSSRRGRGDADRALRARPRRHRLQHRLDAGPRAAARRSSRAWPSSARSRRSSRRRRRPGRASSRCWRRRERSRATIPARSSAISRAAAK